MPQFTRYARDVRAISELLPYYTKTADTPETLLTAARQWHTLGFRAYDDLPDWLATGWLDPHVAHAAKAAGLNPKTATQAAEHALASHYLAWWESDANPHAIYISGEYGEAWDIYIAETYPSILIQKQINYSFSNRTALAVHLTSHHLLHVDFNAWLANRSSL